LEVALNKNQEEKFLVDDLSNVKGQVRHIKLTNNRLSNPFNLFLKRSVDLILGGLLSIVLLPVFIPLVGLLIKLDTRGPVFFLQKRTGLNGKSFYCLKFRSMVVNKDADRLEVQVGDKRITRLGYYLRKYYIDELPQLINVLMGDMSLVGPRPLMLRHTVLYSRIVRNYHDRHLVKPGMTGLAQMRGYHGIIATREDLTQRTSSDIEYIENWTVFGDVYIFFATILGIFRKR
jgi:putative colanic acid biosynthesis UDP-glucose lipid carrier transferase